MIATEIFLKFGGNEPFSDDFYLKRRSFSQYESIYHPPLHCLIEPLSFHILSSTNNFLSFLKKYICNTRHCLPKIIIYLQIPL